MSQEKFTSKIGNPGSHEAIKRGCKCPIMDNRDILNLPIIAYACKFHWEEYNEFEKQLPKNSKKKKHD